MSDLKTAILDAKYIDMIALADFVVRDTGLPDVDSEGNLMPQAIEIAAALFRWAADAEAASAKPATAPGAGETAMSNPQQAPGANGPGQDTSGMMAPAPDGSQTQGGY